MREHGFDASRNPILRPLDTIECRDAILNGDGTEASWPEADVVVGNPPFLGAKLMKSKLRSSRNELIKTTEAVRAAFAGRLAGFTDLVCYWFEKARAMVVESKAARVGLVATSSIRGGTNRPVMDRITNDLEIYNAWSERPWEQDGARVEVSLICFRRKGEQPAGLMLDGKAVSVINPDLTTGVNVTTARSLPENDDVSFLGIQKSGPFDISGDMARKWMRLPTNPNGRSNGEVLKPYWNGDDVTGRPRDIWFIDLPTGLSEGQAALFQAPFEYLLRTSYDPDDVKEKRTLREARAEARDQHARHRWWEPYWGRPEMRRLIASLPRYIVTTETSEHRLFVWLAYPILPDKNLIVIARDDDTTFGILHSRAHELWALRLGTSLEDRPRYTSTTTFASFPFPEGLTLDLPAEAYESNQHAKAIAAAARRINELRHSWLYPRNLVSRVPELGEGSPDRFVPVSVAAEQTLRQRTLTNLYNERPSWLAGAHRDLDAAVAAAYGWPVDLTDDEILERLLALNCDRVVAGRAAAE